MGGADYALHIVSLSLQKKIIPATLFLDYGVTDLLARYIIELAEQHPQQSGETTNAGHDKNLLISGIVGYLGPSLHYISIFFTFLNPIHAHYQHKYSTERQQNWLLSSPNHPPSPFADVI